VAVKHDKHRETIHPIGTHPLLQAHPASFCNGCGATPLPLPFYHCMTCQDFDLCGDCERINGLVLAGGKNRKQVHDPSHPMIKYRTAPTANTPPVFM
jgi:hypothetical protein